MNVYCTNCSYPIDPNGRCSRCRAEHPPHNQSWAEYYAAVARFGKKSYWPTVLLIVVFVTFLWAVIGRWPR